MKYKPVYDHSLPTQHPAGTINIDTAVAYIPQADGSRVFPNTKLKSTGIEVDELECRTWLAQAITNWHTMWGLTSDYFVRRAQWELRSDPSLKPALQYIATPVFSEPPGEDDPVRPEPDPQKTWKILQDHIESELGGNEPTVSYKWVAGAPDNTDMPWDHELLSRPVGTGCTALTSAGHRTNKNVGGPLTPKNGSASSASPTRYRSAATKRREGGIVVPSPEEESEEELYQQAGNQRDMFY